MRRAAAVAVAGLALILVALLFDAAPLFVPGIALVVLGVVAPAWVQLAARAAGIERQLDSERVVEDEPIEATIEVSRGHWGCPAPRWSIRSRASRCFCTPRCRCSRARRAPACGSWLASRAAASGGSSRPRWSSPTRSSSRAWSASARRRLRSCSCSRAPSGCGGFQARVRSGVARPGRPRSSRSAPPTSTACGPTVRARRRRGSTGRRSRAAPDCSSGGCAPTPTPVRWSSSTRAAADRPSISTRPSGPPRRSCSNSEAGSAAACCSPASTARSRSSPI